MRNRLLWLGLTLSVAVAYGLLRSTPWREPVRGGPASSAQPGEPPPAARPPEPPSPRSRIVIGGGSFPGSTEVSLEQDVELAGQVMGPDVRILFAGGDSVAAVRELMGHRPGPDSAGALLVQLGEIFAPRSGRGSRYRRPSLGGATRATVADVRTLLAQALSLQAEQPLWLHVAAHGEQGSSRRDNHIALWAGGLLHVDELAKLHDAAPRPLRAVIASCYSGGFAELAFVAGDEQLGATTAPRCGLFAGTWDRQTSGCDPDPDRRRQEGYSLHFLHALRGEDRDGQPLTDGTVDIDGDGRRSLLEAHTRARIASVSIDVPTTTSERLLRSVQPDSGQPASASRSLLPEDWAVVSALAQRLAIGDAVDAKARWKVMDAQLSHLDARVRGAEDALQDAYLSLAAVLLSRWPVLDDPYHPHFRAAFEPNRAAIAELLAKAPEAHRYRRALVALDAADAAYWSQRVDEAMLSRYLRSHRTLQLAAALHNRGGPDWSAYARLLECERWAPVVVSGAKSGTARQGSADGVE